MVLTLHILTALGSLVAAGVSYFRPSVNGLRLTYFLTASMFTSGTYLVIRNTSHLLEACVMGLIMLAIILFATGVARNKLTHAPAKVDK